MLEYITPESVASEVKLSRGDNNDYSVYLFVEGSTDSALFSTYMDPQNCYIRALKGKGNVLKTISILESEKFSGILAIVDADYWHIRDIQLKSPNLFLTDTHDVETMIFVSPAFDKLLKEYIPHQKPEVLMTSYKDIRTAILNVAKEMGYIRWLNIENNFEISINSESDQMTPIDWHMAIDIENFSVNLDDLLEIICDGDEELKEILQKEIPRCKDLSFDLLQLCNGHDVIYVTFFFIKCRGRRDEVERLTPKDIEKALRLAYDSSFFRDSLLSKQILNWQQRNRKNILKF